MIKKIFCFNSKREILFKKLYCSTIDDEDIINKVLSNQEINFIECKDLIVYKKIDTIYLAFVVVNENEMYILNLIVFLMNTMDKLLGNLNEKSFIYNFKDVHYLLDNFILDGKVISLDPFEISTSPYINDN